MDKINQVEPTQTGGKIKIILKPGKERPLRRGNPWVFSGAIEWLDGDDPVHGSAVDVHAAEGQFMGRGLWNDFSDMPVRVYSQEREPLDESFWRRRIQEAIRFRQSLVGTAIDPAQTDSYRLIFSEADELSGLIADRYADTVLLQVSNSALMPWLEVIAREIKATLPVSRVCWRLDNNDLPDAATPRTGGDPWPGVMPIRENGCTFHVDISQGQKTGYYLDQRENREKAVRYVKDKSVLSAYCYTGSFEVLALKAGATSVLGWDTSSAALDMALKNHALNASSAAFAYEAVDVPTRLRQAVQNKEQWDVVILDPPRLVPSKNGLEKGLRAYKDINRLAMQVIRPGGLLITFSCSGWVDMPDFIRTIGFAAHDAGRTVKILEHLAQPGDHPVPAHLPECAYLKGLIGVVE